MAEEATGVVEKFTGLVDAGAAVDSLKMGEQLLIEYGPKVLAAIAIYIVGKLFAKLIRRIVTKAMQKSEIDPLVVGFTRNIAYIFSMIFVVVAALSQLGLQTTSFIAILGAAGLAVGLALKDSLANFAAGFLLIITRPFKVGDVVEVNGETGKVSVIQILTTTLRTADNKVVIVPNGNLIADSITNYTAEKTRRVDLTVGVSYDADLKQVRNILEEIAVEDERVLKDPEHMIVVGELADNSVNFYFRVWVKTTDYWDVYFAANESVKLRLDAAGIGIPYPQRDVHLYEHKAA